MTTPLTPIETPEEIVWRLLRAVIDPELGCNIVDLGLIYGVEIQDKTVRVTMTLSTRGCPMHDAITGGVKRMLATIDGIEFVEVNLVWEPAWNVSMMSESARRELGCFF